MQDCWLPLIVPNDELQGTYSQELLALVLQSIEDKSHRELILLNLGEALSRVRLIY